MRTRSSYLILLAACASPAVPRSHDPPRPPEPPRRHVFELGVSGDALGLVPRDACRGTVSGDLTVVAPSGVAQTIAVEPREVTEHARTYALGPGPGDELDRPLAWVPLPAQRWDEPGLYRVTGDGLRLSCGELQVVPARIFVARRGEPFALREGDPVPAVAVAPPAPPPAAAAVADLVKRMQTTSFPHRGTLEALALPQTGARATRWGELRRAPRSPTAVVADQFGPAWLAVRAAGKQDDVVIDRPRIVEIVLVDGVHTGDDPAAIRAGQSGGLLATRWRPLDGSPPITLDVGATLDDAAARWRQLVESNRATIDSKLAAMLDDQLGSERARFTTPATTTEPWFTPTWDSAGDRLIVRYALTVRRSAQERRGKLRQVCPYNRPASACRQVEVKRAWGAIARLALEVSYDRSGKLVGVISAGPELELLASP